MEPNNSKEIQTDVEGNNDHVVREDNEQGKEKTNNNEEVEVIKHIKKPLRRDNTRRSKYFKRSFFRNSLRKTL